MQAPEVEPITTLTLATALLGLTGTAVTGWFTYRANRAQTAAEVSKVTADERATEAERLAKQAEQLRQGLLDEIERLQGKCDRQDERIEALEDRLVRVEDENIALRRRVRECEERAGV